MSTGDYSQRFAGLGRLYGANDFGLLSDMHIAVIGVGGVGTWAAEAVARSGIGHITLVDYDTIEISNINRQIVALGSTVERKKCAVMAERIHDINPQCHCTVIDDFLTRDNAADILNRGYHCVIDAIDSISFKALMIYHCKRNKIPIITTGGAGGLTDPTCIEVADLTRTWNDPLAAKVRATLRDRYNWSRNPKRRFGIECVYSTEQPLYPGKDGTVSHCKPGIHGVSLDCSMGYGATSCVTAPFGFIAAQRAILKALKEIQKQKNNIKQEASC